MKATLNQLRYFCEVAELRHFGRAAARLHMSQPPLSRQIAALERDLGTVLLERTSKGVILTAAGERLLADAKNVLLMADQAKRNAVAVGQGEAGRLTVGFTMCAAYSVVPQLVRNFKKAFPRVELQLREMMPSTLKRDLGEGAIDAAISFPDDEAKAFATRSLTREPLDLVLPDRHPLARTKSVAVERLAEELFLIVPRHQVVVLHDSIVQRCQAAGFTPKLGLEVYLQQTIINFVAEGLGVAFVPASMRRSQIKGATFKRIADPPMVEQMLFWSSANRNPCLAGFLAMCESLKTGT
jgi:DNA-binding transcriptional LysR family regulator